MRRLISEEVAEGDELKWTVQVTGDPTPRISWMRNGLVIPHCNEVRLIDVSCSFSYFAVSSLQYLQAKELKLIL